MGIQDNLLAIKSQLPDNVTLVAVSKTKTAEDVMQAYACGHRDFGENYVQELIEKHEALPKDIRWHFIGHLQSNKAKYIAPFVYLIHGVDSFKLLKEINKEAIKNNRVIKCLLQLHIASEETKFGLEPLEAEKLLAGNELNNLKGIEIVGVMAMASNTEDLEQVRREFKQVKALADKFQHLPVLSYGMSNDYLIAIEEGSNHVRIGSLIFGERNYNK